MISCDEKRVIMLICVPGMSSGRYGLYKECNVLLTEQQLSRRKGLIYPQPERMSKVRKSMGAIKQVLGERKRSVLSKRGQMSSMEAEMTQEAEDDDTVNEIESKEKN